MYINLNTHTYIFFLWLRGGWYLLSVNVNLASSELGAKEVQTLQPITAELVWECLKKNRNCKRLQPFVLMTFIDWLLTLRHSDLVLEYV